MIQIFDIKKKRKKMKLEDNEILEKYVNKSRKNIEEILNDTGSSFDGLNDKKAEKLLKQNGYNVVVKNEKKE